MSGDPKRDRYGRYLIPALDGGRERSYMRATTFAKLWADTFHLEQWKMRKAALGLAGRPDLLAAVSAADPGDSKTLNGLVKQAQEAAGSSAGATLGSALHKFTERVDLGEDFEVPAAWAEDIAAYREALTAAGLVVLPEYVEAVVANDTLGIAGTLDRIVRTGDGRLLIGDLKSGKDVPRYMGEIAVQLALYANAEYLYDYAKGERLDMPAVDLEEGLVFWLPAGSGRCEVLSVDLTAGAGMFSALQQIVQYRKRSDFHSVYVPAVVAAEPDSGGTGEPGTGSGGPVDSAVAERLHWVTTAVHYLRDCGLLQVLAARWPEGVPTLRKAGISGIGYTPSLLDSVYTVIRQVAAEHGVSFDMYETAYPGELSTQISATDKRVAKLRARLSLLPKDMQETVLQRCSEHGIPRLSSGRATLGDLKTITHLIGVYEVLAVDNQKSAALHLSAFPDGLQSEVLQAAGVETPGMFSGAVVKRLEVLADGWELNLYGEDLVPTEAAQEKIVEIHGSKTGVTAAGRKAAEILGLVKPTSAKQVFGNVVLFAGTYFTDSENGSEHEHVSTS